MKPNSPAHAPVSPNLARATACAALFRRARRWLLLAPAFFLGGGAVAQPSAVGQWSGSTNFPIVTVHTVLLPNSNVMFYPYSDDPRMWNPVANTTNTLPKSGTNIFCTGHALLADGRVLVTGGHVVNGQGLPFASIYNPFTNGWTRQPDMNLGRWYPSQTALPNGEMLTLSGSYNSNYAKNTLPQVWQTNGAWRNLSNALLSLELYPRQFVGPDGRVFVATSTSRYLDTAGAGAWTTGPLRIAADRSAGSAVMYDHGRILFSGGGGGNATNPTLPLATAEVIDLNAAAPAWRAVGSMSNRRRQHNLTLLPDGSVLCTGGSSLQGNCNPTGVVKVAELWNPLFETWTNLSSWSSANFRGYHSGALLLPDGRVLSSGGDSHPNYEIFSPPYLFKGARPAITSAPANVTLGKAFKVGTPDRDSIKQVTLLKLSAVTHAFNQDQRINFLTFTKTSTTVFGLDTYAPISSNTCPPGYYMLFLVNTNGVPSTGRMIRFDRGAATAWQQSTNTNALATAEIESYDHLAIQGGKSWTTVFSNGFAGVRALQALPNTGAATDTNYVTGAPRLDFRINFKHTGTHYVWVRGWGATGNDDSCHVGLDGAAVASADRVSGFTNGWTWTRATSDGPLATLNITNTGIKTVNLWMREDGLIVDKLVLTTNATYTPTGTGPSQSWRQ
jgi:galactose oxidase